MEALRRNSLVWRLVATLEGESCDAQSVMAAALGTGGKEAI